MSREALLAKLRVVAVERATRARAALDGDAVEGEREAHTLKGEAQLLGRPRLASVAGALEQLYPQVQTDVGLRGLIEEGLDLVESLAADDDAEGAEAFAARAEAALAGGRAKALADGRADGRADGLSNG